mgnify:CR=1 FL=1
MVVQVIHDDEKEREMISLFTGIAIKELGFKLQKVLVNFVSINPEINCNEVIPKGKKALVCGMTIESDNDKEVKILINKSINSTLQAITICHELIHVNQSMAGRLKTVDEGWIWEGCAYPLDTPYQNRPWEIEAKKEEKILFDQVVKEYEQLKHEKRESE